MPCPVVLGFLARLEERESFTFQAHDAEGTFRTLLENARKEEYPSFLVMQHRAQYSLTVLVTEIYKKSPSIGAELLHKESPAQLQEGIAAARTCLEERIVIGKFKKRKGNISLYRFEEYNKLAKALDALGILSLAYADNDFGNSGRALAEGLYALGVGTIILLKVGRKLLSIKE